MAISISMFPRQKAVLTPSFVDEGGLPMAPIKCVWTTAAAGEVTVKPLGYDANNPGHPFLAEIEAVGADGDECILTATAVGDGGNITDTVTVTIISLKPDAVTASASKTVAPVRERPSVGPPH